MVKVKNCFLNDEFKQCKGSNYSTLHGICIHMKNKTDLYDKTVLEPL